MMDLNEDLCKTDFFDLVCPKVEGSCSEALTPVAFIDAIDYNNNNSLSSKSFLDEMLLTDSQTPDTLSQGNLEFLGTLHWSNASSELSLDPSSNWQSDGEVTTLTNLLDPLFVSFEDSKMDAYLLSGSDGPNSAVISSDLISSTFLNDSSASSPPSESDLLSWHKQSPSLSSTEGISDESLLRTALQAKQIPTTVLAKEYSPSQMTELRKVLSFPPLRNESSPTPSDHLQQHNQQQQHLNSSVIISSDVVVGESPYYELKVLDSVFVQPEAIIPNVEELIMTRIDPPFQKFQNQKNNQMNGSSGAKGAISERKINSTTLSAKWTYTTNNNNNSDRTKARRRTKKQTSASNNNKIKQEVDQLPTLVTQLSTSSTTSTTTSKENKGTPPSSPPDEGSNSNGSSSTNGGTTRKERSLHYCNICCKGFKDKYSVNVHVRTHTGEKPFSCNLCGKNFRQKAHLAKHYQTHAAKANGTHPKSPLKRPNNINNNNNIINNTSSSNNNTITISSNSTSS